MLTEWLQPEFSLGERGRDHSHRTSSVPSHIAEGLKGGGARGAVAIAVKDDSFLCNERGREKNEVTGHQDSDSSAVEATFVSSSVVC